MPDEVKDPQAAPAETAGDGEAAPKQPTLAELSEQVAKIAKQNSDKDSFITKLQGENREAREQNKAMKETLENLSGALQGKSGQQKDALLSAQRAKFIEKGYDEASVDLILESIELISDKKAAEKIAPIITDTVQELIESDSKIDQKLVQEHQEAIWDEYKGFVPELTPRKIKANFKKAYNAVRDRLAAKAKAEAGGEEEREAELAGAGAPAKGAKQQAPDEEKKFVDSILKAGPVNSRFI